jgi:hypothetical protein
VVPESSGKPAWACVCVPLVTLIVTMAGGAV